MNLVSKKAFTLIEVIVVLIIVGVLSTLAITSLFSWIERSKAVDAMLNLKQFANQIEGCAQTKGYNACINFSSSGASGFFAYWDTQTGVGPDCFYIDAVRQNLQGDPGGILPVCCGQTATQAPQSGVMYCHDPAGHRIIGYGVYQGM